MIYLFLLLLCNAATTISAAANPRNNLNQLRRLEDDGGDGNIFEKNETFSTPSAAPSPQSLSNNIDFIGANRTCGGKDPKGFVSVDFVYEIETDFDNLSEEIEDEIIGILFQAILDSIVEFGCGRTFGELNNNNNGRWQIEYASRGLKDKFIQSCDARLDTSRSCDQHLGSLLIGHNGTTTDDNNYLESQVINVVLQIIASVMDSGAYTGVVNEKMESWVFVEQVSFVGVPIYGETRTDNNNNDSGNSFAEGGNLTTLGKWLVVCCVLFFLCGCFGCWFIHKVVMRQEEEKMGFSRTVLEQQESHVDTAHNNNNGIDPTSKRSAQEMRIIGVDKSRNVFQASKERRKMNKVQSQTKNDRVNISKEQSKSATENPKPYNPDSTLLGSKEEQFDFCIRRKAVDHAGCIRNEIEL